MSFLSRFIGKKNPLDIKLDKLQENLIILEMQIKKIESEILDIEDQIAYLFEQAKKAKSKSEELTIATKIKTLNQRKNNLQKTHAQLNKQMMLVSNLIIIKENEAILKNTPTWNILKSMSAEELEQKLTEMQLDAQNLDENLNRMLGYTDQAISTGVNFETDEEISEILDSIRAVKEGELDPEIATRKITKDEKKKVEMDR